MEKMEEKQKQKKFLKLRFRWNSSRLLLGFIAFVLIAGVFIYGDMRINDRGWDWSRDPYVLTLAVAAFLGAFFGPDKTVEEGLFGMFAKKKKRRAARRIWTIFMILGILSLTLVIYQVFGVGDVAFWVKDVLTLLLLLVLIFLAAAAFVWILTVIRKARSH